MTWSKIAQIAVGQDWQFTPAIAPELGYVRLKCLSAVGSPLWIGQVDLDHSIDIWDERRIAASPYPQILEFEAPPFFNNRAIALRVPSSSSPFEVEIEVSNTPLISDGSESIDIANVLQSLTSGQSQILQQLQSLEVELDPSIITNIQALVAGQTQILQRLNQPIEAQLDPTQASLLEECATNINALVITQVDQTSALQQLQSEQAQILQLLNTPNFPAYSLIVSGYTISQSSNYNNQLVGAVANLSDNNGATGAATNNSASEWIKATFANVTTIRAIRVGGGSLPAWGIVSQYLNNAQLQYSTDDTNWLTLLTVQNIWDAGPGQFVLFPLGQPITARFWRLWMPGWLATTEFRFFS